MKEILAQAVTILRGMWKYRWPGLLVAWVVALVGAVIVFRIPDQFESSARIYVDTQSILKPLMAGLAIQPNVEQQVGMLSRTLISRPNVEKLIRMADLDLNAKSKVQQDKLIDDLSRTLQIGGTGRDNLYTLAYRDSDQDKARRVIQSLVSIFVESSLGASRKDTDSAKVFLNEQIKSYEGKLEEAEARVKAFRLRNIDRQGTDGKDAASRIGELNELLNRSRLELREAENSRDAAKQQLDNEKAQSANLTTKSLLRESAINVSTPEIDARIEAQKRNLDMLLQRYTEQHPDVANTRRMLKDLEEVKRRDVAELRKAAMATPPPAATAPANLAVQELSRIVSTTEVQVAALKARVAEYTSRLATAREGLKLAPQIEVEAAQLNRDYAILRKSYDDLVGRRQSAEMSGELESVSGVADFRLIDPPRVSPKPVSPNRLVLLPMALVAALGAGLFISFAASQLRPAFYGAADLRHRTGLPILGVVSLVMDDGQNRAERMDLLRFMIASGGLVGIFIAGLITMSVLAR